MRSHPPGNSFFPNDLLRDEIEAGHRASGGDVNALVRRAGANAFHVERLAGGVEAGSLDALNEAVAVVNVEHENAVPAVFEIIPNARRSDVEKMFFGGR
jgi:hypothetical protein